MNFERLRTDLEYITQARTLPEGEVFGDVLGRLDQFAKQPSVPERLEHYLSKRSYVKALAWLDNPDMKHHP